MRSLFLSLLLIGAQSLSASALAQEEGLIRFRFAPPDGSHWIEEMQDRREYDHGKGETLWIQETTQRDELLFSRSEDGGFVLTRVLGPAEMTIGGEALDNPILVASEGSRLELQLDEVGRAKSVKGYHRLIRKLERSLSAEQWSKFQKTYSVSSANAAEMGRWNDRVAGWVGAEIETGDLWGFIESYPAGSERILVKGTMSFDGFTEIGGQRGYKLLYEFGGGEYLPSLEGLERVLDFRDSREGQAPPAQRMLQGTRVRVIIPETGLLIYENTQVRWTKKSPPGKPDVEVFLQTVYRLHPVGAKD